MPELSSAVYAGATVASLYRWAFKSSPHATAIVSEDGTALSYAELESLCHRFARLLRAQGLQRQDAVALLTGNRAQAIAAAIAAQFIGAQVVSLHPLASEEDHLFVLRDAQVKAVVADANQYAQRAQALAAQGFTVLPLDDGALGTGLCTAAQAVDPADFPIEAQAQEITKLGYSGGTTGKPKGILHTHRTTVTMLLQMLATYEWPQAIRYLVATPISHAAGSFLLPTLLRGGTVYLLQKYTAESFLRCVEQHRITFSFLVPTQIYGLLDSPALAEHDVSSLSLVLYGAAPMAPARLQQALENIGPVFGQIYGQAEAPMCITYLSKQDHARPELLASCGKLMFANEVKLLNANMQEVPTGEIGELCVRSPLVMQGYLNRPEENAKVFAGDWLHTGDMARMDEAGYLYIVDRAKDMIISGGFNVYPSEVENCLAQHPDVAVSAVIGVPDDKWGEAVTAIVVRKPGATVSQAEIIAFVTQKKGVVNAPKTVVFEDEIPLTALGKIDRKAIRSRYWANRDRQVG